MRFTLLLAANVGYIGKDPELGNRLYVLSDVFGIFLSRTSSTNHVQSANHKKKRDSWKPYADDESMRKKWRESMDSLGRW